MLNLIFQIILGILTIIIMAFIAYSIFDREYLSSIRINNTNKKETKIFTGIYPFTQDEVKIETINKNDPYYLNINPSVNQNGGAEYSYNFWLYFDITESTGKIIDKYGSAGSEINKDSFIVLFYKGVKQFVPYKQNKLSCDSEKGDSKPYPYILVKNPLVKLNNNGKELVVEYNNINNPDSFNSSAVNLICREVKDKMYGTNVNKLGVKNINTDMYTNTWNMITIVLQESPSNEEKLFSNRTNCKIYFNSTLISDRSTYNNDIIDNNNEVGISTVMKNNIGNLFINPKKTIGENIKILSSSTEFTEDNTANKTINLLTKIENKTEKNGIKVDSPIKMANMSYFNYALTDNEILTLYNNGFDKNISDIVTRTMGLSKIVQGDKISYNLMANTDGVMPIEPI